MRKTYNWVVGWSEKKSAERALAALSFAESSFFPIPPDPLLIAMVTAQPKKWLRLAVITTGASVVGGMLGYFIGSSLIEAALPTITNLGYKEAYETAVKWFENWGVWAVLIAGFTPVPYKIFTIAGGAAHMALLPFFIGSIVGRGGRFFLVSYLMQQFGRRYKDKIEKYIDILGFAFIGLIIAGVLVLKFVH
ncbi:hypothetical protein CR956_00515 [Candidatus Saccharibacteria bacterium]|nr:MAG: hypothetical protein CR956_00515 [Candidatus Saccharibacteria bacterium]